MTADPMPQWEVLYDGQKPMGRVMEARTFQARTRGLLGRKELEPGIMMWIRPAASIHTFGMRFTIDLVFLDGAFRVVKVCPRVGPWQMRLGGFGATSVLEAQSGWLDCPEIKVGATMVFRAAP